MTAGFHPDATAADYHADRLSPEPSLSSSVAAILLDRSPRHAWAAHPRLNPAFAPDEEPTRAREIGTAAHKLILGRGAEVVTIDAADYKGGAARTCRAELYAAGKAPILRPDMGRAQTVASAVAEQVAHIEDCAGFFDARPELVAVAQDMTGAWLRCMVDRFEDRETSAVIWDIKTGDTSAAPHALGRRIASMGYDVQAAFYERVILALRPALAGRLTFRWVFVENDPPHLVTVAELDNAGLEIGRKKVAAAVALWNRCIAEQSWPGYPAHIVRVEYPGFAEQSWLNRELSDAVLRDMGADPFTCLAPWRPPAPATELLGAC